MLEMGGAKETLGFTKDELKRTRFYRELYEEIYTTAKAEGVKETILQLLTRCFGDLPAEMEEKIRDLAPERISALAGILLDMTSLGVVDAWLQEHSEN
ncbi:DUF4351 domain-containing protein [Thermosynechococcus sichuanensis]|uniref:DUF4351 domain-containing protein n=1 Tax=Thermosynechococcus sichuanensis TaxID=3161974 RepID=UPI000EB6766E|nr:DUF4351 domain-containing protein [Thermosynechococcus vestitus]